MSTTVTVRIQAGREWARGRAPWMLAALGLLALYLPTVVDLWRTYWTTDSQGHGPLVLGLTLWLAWRQWPTPQCLVEASPLLLVMGWIGLAAGVSLYVLGRAFDFPMFEVGSATLVCAGLLALIGGRSALAAMWFPLIFLFFLVPLPGALIDTLTQPMKLGVSWTTEQMLRLLDYPVARTGVILDLGPYRMLVADACAGLQTLFTLEAMGLLYLNVVQHSSPMRNVTLAALIVPISFVANVIRVVILCLITYHFGDEAGQGYLHGFAGMILFLSALTLIVSCDSLLRVAFHSRPTDQRTAP